MEESRVSGGGVWAVAAGLLAMILIYTLTALLPKIAAAADRLLDKLIKPREDKKPPVSGEYKVYDIYEGEMNLTEISNDSKGANENGKGQ